MTTVSDPVALPHQPFPLRSFPLWPFPLRHLASLLQDALRIRALGPWPRRAPAPRLTDHLLRDLGLTRADVEGL